MGWGARGGGGGGSEWLAQIGTHWRATPRRPRGPPTENQFQSNQKCRGAASLPSSPSAPARRSRHPPTHTHKPRDPSPRTGPAGSRHAHRALTPPSPPPQRCVSRGVGPLSSDASCAHAARASLLTVVSRRAPSSNSMVYTVRGPTCPAAPRLTPLARTATLARPLPWRGGTGEGGSERCETFRGDGAKGMRAGVAQGGGAGGEGGSNLADLGDDRGLRLRAQGHLVAHALPHWQLARRSLRDLPGRGAKGRGREAAGGRAAGEPWGAGHRAARGREAAGGRPPPPLVLSGHVSSFPPY